MWTILVLQAKRRCPLPGISRVAVASNRVHNYANNMLHHFMWIVLGRLARPRLARVGVLAGRAVKNYGAVGMIRSLLQILVFVVNKL